MSTLFEIFNRQSAPPPIQPQRPVSPNFFGSLSYDDAKFNMVHKLGDLMMCTENEHTKSVLRNAINQIENG